MFKKVFLLLFIIYTGNSDTLEDGIIGSTREKIRKKFKKPNFIHVFSNRKDMYFTPKEWETAKLFHGGIGNDTYRLKRKNYEIQYRFDYEKDYSKSKLYPQIRCYRYTILFDKPPSLKEIPNLIPEFVPATQKGIKVYLEKKPKTRIFFCGKESKLASFISRYWKEEEKYEDDDEDDEDDDEDEEKWRLEYQVILQKKTSEISGNEKVEAIKVGIGSDRFDFDEDIKNPFLK